MHSLIILDDALVARQSLIGFNFVRQSAQLPKQKCHCGTRDQSCF